MRLLFCLYIVSAHNYSFFPIFRAHFPGAFPASNAFRRHTNYDAQMANYNYC